MRCWPQVCRKCCPSCSQWTPPSGGRCAQVNSWLVLGWWLVGDQGLAVTTLCLRLQWDSRPHSQCSSAAWTSLPRAAFWPSKTWVRNAFKPPGQEAATHASDAFWFPTCLMLVDFLFHKLMSAPAVAQLAPPPTLQAMSRVPWGSAWLSWLASCGGCDRTAPRSAGCGGASSPSLP